MALEEIRFDSLNGRDHIHAWIWSPTVAPRAIVQIVHGLGEHCRRYRHLIVTLLEAGYVVAADDHAGHGATAMESGVWADAGERGLDALVEDEHTLYQAVTQRYPDLPYFVFGHSLGSMIARDYAARHVDGITGLLLCGVAAQMRGIEQVLDRRALADAVAANPTGVADAFLPDVFAGFVDRYDEVRGPTDWVALDPDVVADHGRDPLNNFGAPLSLRFLKDFVDLYDLANGKQWADQMPADLPVLLLAGDQDPVANYGEGAYHVANLLWDAGLVDVRTRVFSGVRHEVHNEPATRAEVEDEIVVFVEKHLS